MKITDTEYSEDIRLLKEKQDRMASLEWIMLIIIWIAAITWPAGESMPLLNAIIITIATITMMIFFVISLKAGKEIETIKD